MSEANIVETIARATHTALMSHRGVTVEMLSDRVPAIITALEAKGYAIVPCEPTPAMLASVEGEDSDKYVARGRAVSAWQAMISTGKAKA